MGFVGFPVGTLRLRSDITGLWPLTCPDVEQPPAALIYQHATRDRDKAIALALGDLVREVRTVQARETPEVAN